MFKKLILAAACFCSSLLTVQAKPDTAASAEPVTDEILMFGEDISDLEAKDNQALRGYIIDNGKAFKKNKVIQMVGFEISGEKFPHATKIPPELNPGNIGKDFSVLTVKNFPELREVNADLRMFPKLRHLRFQRIGFESFVLDKNFKLRKDGTYGQFNELTSITFDRCNKLKQLPSALPYIPSLKVIKVDGCDNLDEASIQILKTLLRRGTTVQCDGVVRTKLEGYLDNQHDIKDLIN